MVECGSGPEVYTLRGGPVSELLKRYPFNTYVGSITKGVKLCGADMIFKTMYCCVAQLDNCSV